MRYFLTREAVLKMLEHPAVYNIRSDELYELDDASFEFLRGCGFREGCEGHDNKFLGYCIREGLLSKQKFFSKRPALIRSPQPSLRYLELQITKNCNLTCSHCYIGDVKKNKAEKGQKDELSPHQIRDVLREFEEMQGLRVLISGGEPLIHSRFQEINAMLPEFFLRKILMTNGLLLTKGILSELNVQEIQISIDGLEYAHDSLRGKGTFRRAIGAIKRSLDAGFQVSVATMIHRGNLGDFDDMERLFRELRIKDWSVDIPCVSGRLREHPEFQITPEVGGKYLRYGYGEGLHGGTAGFACGTHLMSVTADGKAAKCTFYANNPVGSITDGLRKNWQRIKPVKIDALTCDCRYLHECRGGCRYRALLLGDELGKDFYKCYSYGIVGEDF